jgi:hypothetical protein
VGKVRSLIGFSTSRPDLFHEISSFVTRRDGFGVSCAHARRGGRPPATVNLEFERLPAVVDAALAREKSAALVHESWGSNLFIERVFAEGTTILSSTALYRALATGRTPLFIST